MGDNAGLEAGTDKANSAELGKGALEHRSREKLRLSDVMPYVPPTPRPCPGCGAWEHMLAAFEAGAEVSEAALGDTELNGAAIVAALGRGADYGGAGGALFGGAASVSARATRRLREQLASATSPGAIERGLRSTASRQAFETRGLRGRQIEEAVRRGGPDFAERSGRAALDNGVVRLTATPETMYNDAGEVA